MSEWRSLALVLDGRPVPKGRHRTRAGKPYTPAATVAAEEALATLALSKRVKFDGPVQMLIEFRVRVWRGDLDNLAKLVMDALAKSRTIRNDRQIKRLTVEEIVSDAESTSVWVSDYAQRVE